MIDYQKRKSRIRNKASLHRETEKTIKSLIVTLSVMILVLMVGSFIIGNNKAQRGYTLEQEKLKNEHLMTINSSLITKITQSTSFLEIKNKENIETMDDEPNKIFITPEDNAVN